MPIVEGIFSKLNGSKYFSTLNLHARYHHIPLDEDSIPKTAFTSSFGIYEYLKVLIGLAQAPAYFQELMNKVLNDLPFAIAYLYDITICTKTQKGHLDIYNKFSTNFIMQKCHFFAKEIQYLDHVLSTTGIEPLLPRQQLFS